MLFYGKTDIGQRRAANQDNFIIHRYSEDVLFAVVCDGMGGASGGNIAMSNNGTLNISGGGFLAGLNIRPPCSVRRIRGVPSFF